MARRDANPNTPTRLGEGPVIDPRVQDPRALAYARGARMRAAPPPLEKYTEPVDGGPSPPIPRLDGDPHIGHTMAEHALSERPQARPSARAGNSIVAPMPVQNLAPGLMRSGILMGDMLPEAARKDPAFQEGVGSMLAQNQPALAKKYGVVRHGAAIPPQQLFDQPSTPGAPRGRLSPETLKGLEALSAANVSETAQVDEEPAPPPPPAPKGEKALSEKETKEILEQLDDFDFNRFRQAVMKDQLNNDAQKEIVEKRLKPLDVVDLIMKGRVSQVVPILPGKFEPEFQSLDGSEDLTLKRWLVEEARGLEVSDRYYTDKYCLMGLTVALKAINKRPLPDCRNADGDLDEELFKKKYRMVSKFDFHMLSSLYLNWTWFDIRVRKLFVVEELGNG